VSFRMSFAARVTATAKLTQSERGPVAVATLVYRHSGDRVVEMRTAFCGHHAHHAVRFRVGDLVTVEVTEPPFIDPNSSDVWDVTAGHVTLDEVAQQRSRHLRSVPAAA
jgi:hypothetical protein